MRILYTGFVVLLLLSACGSATTPPATEAGPVSDAGATSAGAPACPDAPGPIAGALVFGADNNLMAIDPEGGEATALTSSPGGSYAYDPAWSPDGQTLAYTLSSPAADPNLSWLPIGQICGLDRATGKGRLLARGATPLDSLTEPIWTPDGQALLVTMHQPKLDANRQYTGDSMTITRFDLTTGAGQPLIKDGLSPTLSPDGARLVYLQLNPENLNMTLMFAQPDGQGATPLPPQSETLGVIRTPRWSPDGAQLAFTASSGVQGRARPADRRTLLDRLLGVRVAAAHGAPADVWMTAADGSGLRRVTNKGLDDPHVAWGPDGQQIAYTTGFGGVFVLDLSSGEEQTLTDLGNYGGISWAPR